MILVLMESMDMDMATVMVMVMATETAIMKTKNYLLRTELRISFLSPS